MVIRTEYEAPISMNYILYILNAMLHATWSRAWLETQYHVIPTSENWASIVVAQGSFFSQVFTSREVSNGNWPDGGRPSSPKFHNRATSRIHGVLSPYLTMTWVLVGGVGMYSFAYIMKTDEIHEANTKSTDAVESAGSYFRKLKLCHLPYS